MDRLYLFTLILVIITCVTFFFHVLFHKHRAKYNGYQRLPPGNFGLPFLGETLDFLCAGWKGHPEKFFSDRVAKYSSDVFKTSIIGENVAILSIPDGNKFLFSNENKFVVTWWPDNVKKLFPSTARTSPYEESTKFRKVLPQFLKPEALQRYIGIMDSLADAHFKLSWEKKDEVVVFPLAKRYTFSVACKLFMSFDDPEEIERLYRPFKILASGVFSIPINLPGTTYYKAIKASSFIRKKILEIIQKRKGDATWTNDILSHLLTACDDMDEESVADKVLALLIAGHDTASVCITFIVKYLSELPRVYEAVYNEQMGIANGGPLTWKDLQKMKYTWQVACEAMRLHPPIPGAFREAIKELEFDGFVVPKGWKVYWSAYSTHRNAGSFPNPYAFDPSRFEGDGPTPYTYVPFGGGPKMCPGKEYARLEILVFIHHLVKRFHFEKVFDHEKVVVDPLPVPQKGLPLRLYNHDTLSKEI